MTGIQDPVVDKDTSSSTIAEKKKTIYIIGAGWYGVHTALQLAKEGKYHVILIEKNEKLFSELSGQCGVRLHQGLHYPRSPRTREACREGYEEFIKLYPDLMVEHDYSIYALGKEPDALKYPSKVSKDEFTRVCKSEYPESKSIDPDDYGYKGLHMAQEITEDSIKGGSELHAYFEPKLREAGVELRYGTTVDALNKLENGQIKVIIGESSETADSVVNATGFQALLPSKNEPLPFNMQVKYQSCLIFLYEDTKPTSDKPFSFIVMDGAYPCIMPYGYGRCDPQHSSPMYLLYHAQYTILGSADDQQGAKAISDKFIGFSEEQKREYRKNFEDAINIFWPDFDQRFKPIGYKVFNLAKIQCDKEFRSTVSFSRGGVIYIVPGKINDIQSIYKDVSALIKKEKILNEGTYFYRKGSSLDLGQNEIRETPKDGYFNTCSLQSLHDFELKQQEIHKIKHTTNNMTLFPFAKKNPEDHSNRPQFPFSLP